ncbi:MAG TPA: hypothetical protein VF516_40210 [Kofleriaceae bacterium]
MKALAVMVFAVCISACGAIQVDGDPGSDSPVVVDLSSHEQRIGDWVVEGRDPAPPDAVSDAVPRPSAAGPVSCVVIQYCDAPGPDGTRCVQKGCSVQEALTECTIEAPRECHPLVCPFVFLGHGGVRFNNGECM